MRVIIDADQICYACGFACEGEPIANVLQTVKTALLKIIEETEAESYEVYIGGTDNFREDIAVTKEYKGNRDNRKPSSFYEIREYLINVWGAKVVDEMEADDAVSIRLYEDFLNHGGEKDSCTLILSSPDKDLKNTPGWHYNPRTGIINWIDLQEAERHFLKQLLVGDTVDNIPGLPYVTKDLIFKWGLKNVRKTGCGDKTAQQIMDLLGDPYPKVMACYISWGEAEGMSEEQTKAYLIEQAKLLWMIRELDEFNEPIMFELDEASYEIGRDISRSYCTSGESGEGSEGDSESPRGEEGGSSREVPR